RGEDPEREKDNEINKAVQMLLENTASENSPSDNTTPQAEALTIEKQILNLLDQAKDGKFGGETPEGIKDALQEANSIMGEDSEGSAADRERVKAIIHKAILEAKESDKTEPATGKGHKKKCLIQ
ncbi:hypothetical protein AAMO2058_001452300, partial [Amorphochlora amoebiformis]